MLDDRFWSKVDRCAPGDCWEWTANKNNKGYGMFSCRGLGHFHKKLAHRLSYEEANGAIPAGMHILHSCDNPACVNPAHLSAGSRSANMSDCASKSRGGNQTLETATVIALLKDYVSGLSRSDLSRKYGVPLSSLSDYTTGKSRQWLHGKHGCPTYAEIRAAQNTKPGAKISPDIVRSIRDGLAQGETGRSLAKMFGIHPTTVSDIKARRIWADV